MYIKGHFSNFACKKCQQLRVKCFSIVRTPDKKRKLDIKSETGQ